MRKPARKLNYQHLLYFWTVVRTGSLARAGQELSLSPPTISTQLRLLEARLGEQLLAKSGRRLVTTDAGRLVYDYADAIFTLGRELVDALEHRPAQRPLHLVVGIDDVVPKEIACQLLEPVLALEQPVRMVCREGMLERLAADLAVRDIDLVISDASITPGLNVRAYSHHLGSCDELWMGTRNLVASLRRGFPRSLHGARVLLPTHDTAIRRSLDLWFDRHDVRPLVVGEFEDYALLREYARAGHGIAPVPAILAAQFARESGLVKLGRATGVEARFYAITVERRISHPAVAAVVELARRVFH